jgi:hypothetical protein
LPVTEFEFPFHGNCDLIMAAVLPSVITKEKPAYLVCENRVSKPVDIALYSSDGNSKIRDIRAGQSGDNEGLLILPWDAKDVPPGNYRIRWTVRDSYREFPVEVK